jgi:hypothetical protein
VKQRSPAKIAKGCGLAEEANCPRQQRVEDLRRAHRRHFCCNAEHSHTRLRHRAESQQCGGRTAQLALYVRQIAVSRAVRGRRTAAAGLRTSADCAEQSLYAGNALRQLSARERER